MQTLKLMHQRTGKTIEVQIPDLVANDLDCVRKIVWAHEERTGMYHHSVQINGKTVWL